MSSPCLPWRMSMSQNVQLVVRWYRVTSQGGWALPRARKENSTQRAEVSSFASSVTTASVRAANSVCPQPRQRWHLYRSTTIFARTPTANVNSYEEGYSSNPATSNPCLLRGFVGRGRGHVTWNFRRQFADIAVLPSHPPYKPFLIMFSRKRYVCVEVTNCFSRVVPSTFCSFLCCFIFLLSW